MGAALKGLYSAKKYDQRDADLGFLIVKLGNWKLAYALNKVKWGPLVRQEHSASDVRSNQVSVLRWDKDSRNYPRKYGQVHFLSAPPTKALLVSIGSRRCCSGRGAPLF